MIAAEIFRDNKGQIIEFTINGHAEFNDAGKDIVCAGVSSISGAAIIGLERLLSLKPEISKNKGKLKCTLPDNISDEKMKSAQVILETMVLGIKDISESYKSFVKVFDKEV